MARFLYVATLLGAAMAVPWEGAVPTPIDDAVADYRGFSPAPTHGVMDLLQVFGVKRDVTEICGYENMALTSRRWCTSPFVCATNTEYSAYGCCRGSRIDTCNYKTSCVPYVSVKKCGSKCEEDVHLRVCFDPDEPYCETAYSFTGTQTFTGFACRSTSSDLTAYVFPSYTSDTRSLPIGTPHRETITITIGESVATITHQPADATAQDGDEDPDTTPVPDTAGTTGTNTTGSDDQPKSKEAPVGAIVGGVMGGLVGLAAIVGLVVFYLLHRKKSSGTAPTPPSAADASAPRRLSQPPEYTGPVPPPQAYFDPTQPPYMQQQYHPGIPPAPYGGPPPPFVGASNGYYDPKGMPFEMNGVTSPTELGPASPTLAPPQPLSPPAPEHEQPGQAGTSTGATPQRIPQGPAPKYEAS